MGGWIWGCWLWGGIGRDDGMVWRWMMGWCGDGWCGWWSGSEYDVWDLVDSVLFVAESENHYFGTFIRRFVVPMP